MYKLARLLLIGGTLASAYAIGLLVILFPWAWIALGLGALYGLAKRGYRYTAYGTARWAELSDLQGVIDE